MKSIQMSTAIIRLGNVGSERSVSTGYDPNSISRRSALPPMNKILTSTYLWAGTAISIIK